MKKFTFLLVTLMVTMCGFSQTFEKLWEFSTTQGNLVSADDVKNGFIYHEGELFLSSRRAATTQVVIYDAITGEIKMEDSAIKQLPHHADFTMGTGGDLAIDRNGAIYAVSAAKPEIIKWESATSGIATVFTTLPEVAATSGLCYGVDVYVDGNGNGCLIAVTQTTKKAYYVPISNNIAGEVKEFTLEMGSAPRVCVVDEKTFWVDGTSTQPTRIILNDDFTIKSQEKISVSINNSGNGVTQFDYKGKTYLLVAANNHATTVAMPPHSAALYEFNPEDLSSLTMVGEYLPEEGMGATVDYSHFVKPVVNIEKGSVYIYLMGGANGIAAYKFTDDVDTPVDPVFTFGLTEVIKGMDSDPFSIPLMSETDGEINYESSKEEVATVDQTGKVTIVGTGEATITATATATSAYNSITASYNLIVSGDPVFEYPQAAVEKLTTDEPFKNPLVNNSNAEKVTYESSEEDVATIDEEGEVTIIGVGTTTIKASVPETNIYTSATASYTLTVSLASPEFKYNETTIEKLTTDAAFTNQLTNNSDAETVTYTSSVEGVATISTNGEVTIVGVGTTTITASVPETNMYNAATATYTLTVKEPVIVKAPEGAVLYMAVKGGDISYMELDASEREVVSTGISAGGHAFNLLFDDQDDLLYVVDAGKQVGIVPEGGTNVGDGEIFVMNYDEDSQTFIRETVLENVGVEGNAYYDPHYAYIDKEEELMYFADRNNGIYHIPLDGRNLKISDATTFVLNNQLGYYNKETGYGWGAVNGPIFKHEDVWHWTKRGNYGGIHRFVESDIMDGASVEPESGSILTSRKIRGLAVDTEDGYIYYSDHVLGNIIRGSLATGTPSNMIDNSIMDDEGVNQNEPVFVTGIALDKEAGYLYWAYRGPELGEDVDAEEYYQENPLHRSGIKRIKISDIGTDIGMNQSKIEYFIVGVEAYGIAIKSVEREGPKDPTFAYGVTNISKVVGDENFTNPLNSNTDGQITYTSSEEAVATVDSNGEVTVKAAGSTVITASASATETYNAATASYTLTVGTVGIDAFNYQRVVIISTKEGVRVTFEGEAKIEIIGVNGIQLVSVVAEGEYEMPLSNGMYIIKVNGVPYKVIK